MFKPSNDTDFTFWGLEGDKYEEIYKAYRVYRYTRQGFFLTVSYMRKKSVIHLCVNYKFEFKIDV